MMADEQQIITVQPSDVVSAPSVGDLHGDDFLKTLAPEAAAQIKAYAEGRRQWPGGFAMRSPYWIGLQQAVTQYDPDFDAGTPNARFNLRKKLTDPSAANAGAKIQALNQAILHLGQLSSEGDALNNFAAGEIVNAPINAIERRIGLGGRLNAYEATAEGMLSPELTRAWRGGSGAEADVQTWRDKLSSAKSPSEMHAAQAAIANGIQAAADNLREQRDSTLGKWGADIQILSPQAQQILSAVKAKAGQSTQPVPMVAPDGRQLMVPPDKVQELTALGAKPR